MATNIVSLPYDYFPAFDRGRPLFNADIYVGIVDLDPENPSNQKQVTLRLEDGSEVDVSQPISTGSGGVVSYNGSPAQVLVDGEHSIKVLNNAGSQVYYSPNVTKGVPITEASLRTYTDIVFDSVNDMIEGIPKITWSPETIGTYATVSGNTWKQISFSSPMTIDNFENVTYVTISGDGTTFTTVEPVENQDAIVRCKFENNSNDAPTLNGKPLVVLDTYATEQSQWTGNVKDKPKTDIYRNVVRGLISADVIYELEYIPSNDSYRVHVSDTYKRVIIQCGVGSQFEELNDAVHFAGQFRPALQADPQFYGYANGYPLFTKITVVVNAGVSEMKEQLRVAEVDMNHVEILAFKNVFGGSVDSEIDFTGELDTDDLGFLNFWKTRFGEVRGFRINMKCDFASNLQSAVRYQRTEARFKDMTVDMSQATYSLTSGNVFGLVCDREIESFGNVMIAPSADLGRLTAVRAQGLVLGFELQGFWENALSIPADTELGGIDTSGATVRNLVSPGPCVTISFGSAGNNLNAFNLSSTSSVPHAIYLRSATCTVPPAWDEFLDRNTWFGAGTQFSSNSPLYSRSSFFQFLRITNALYQQFGILQAVAGTYNLVDINGEDGVSLTNSNNSKGVRYRDNNIVSTFEPLGDNETNLGVSGSRYITGYFVNAPSVTSDIRYKEEYDVTEAERRVASKIKLMKFRYTESLERKGSNARYHFGYSAQQIIESFESEGLDPMDYAMLRKVPIDDNFGGDISLLSDNEFKYEIVIEQVNAFVLANK